MPATTTYDLGYQLFSIRDEMAVRPVQTLKELRAMGYRHFEIYGFDADRHTLYGMSAQELKVVLDDLGLKVSSGHYTFHEWLDDEAGMLRYTDACIAAAAALDSPYLTWPWMAPEQRNLATYRRLPEVLNRIAERVRAAGMAFTYHNNGFEFADHDGENGYDIILKGTDPELVQLQLDVFWVMHAAKTTPQELVQRHPGRYVMWHLKDMDARTRDYTELGNGALNYLRLLPDPVVSGLEYLYIEQGGNFTESSTESARASAAYYQKYLAELL